MWVALTALLGFVGGVVVTHLSAFLQRRNWQRQELMKSYATLFSVGEEALRIANTVELVTGNANAAILEAIQAQNADRSAYKSDPRVVELRESVRLLYEEFQRQADPKLRQAVSQCWLLERDSETRDRIEQYQKRYLAAKVGLRQRFDNMEINWVSGGRRSAERQEQIDRQPHVEGLFGHLESLREWVASKHFHGGGGPKTPGRTKASGDHD